MAGRKTPASLMHEAASHYQAGRYDKAQAAGRKLIKLMPRHPDVTFLMGAVQLAKGKPEKAVSLLQRSLDAQPRQPMALNSLGECHRQLGDLDKAIAAYRKAIALNADEFGFHNNLAVALLAKGDPQAALEVLDPLLVRAPRVAMGHINRGNALVALGRHREAAEAFERALALAPDRVEALQNLASCQLEVGRFAAAVSAYERYLALPGSSEDGDAWCNLGQAQQALGLFDGAEASFRRAAALDGASQRAYGLLNLLCRLLGRAEEGVRVTREGCDRYPDSPDVWRDLGHVLRGTGDDQGAREAYRKCVALNPGDGAAYRGLVGLDKAREGDPLIEEMLELAGRASELTDEQEMHLRYALAKSYEDLGSYGSAFEHLTRANHLNRLSYSYDAADKQAELAALKSVFDPAFLARNALAGVDDPRPIFILGMPRSGTTLVEQILVSHDQVAGAGEVLELSNIEHALSAEPDTADYPHFYGQLGEADLRAIGEDYLRRLRHYVGDAPRVTDKLPHNFLRVGLIRTVLPNARIIHCRRAPLDNCLSIYKNHFSSAHGYSADLSELGHYYRCYRDLMAHWRAVLGEEAFLDIDYEELVADPEQRVRALLEFCGLEWQDACLAFHKTRRVVNTLSVSQVRRPIYRDSLKLSERYGERLAPLIDALGDTLAPDGAAS